MESHKPTTTPPKMTFYMEGGKKFLSIPHSEQNPYLEVVAQYICMVLNFSWLEFLLEKHAPHLLKPFLDDPIFDISTELAKVDNILFKMETLNEEIADDFLKMATGLPMARAEENLEKAQNFASANNLIDAFKTHNDINQCQKILTQLEPDDMDLIQAALACQMLGLDKTSRTLLKQFTKNIFLQGNELYYYLSVVLGAGIGRRDTVKEAGKNGNDSKHRINRQLRTKAVELYLNGSFHNPRHATKQLLPTVAKISSELGSALEWENNGFDRLYGWLRAAKKVENV